MKKNKKATSRQGRRKFWALALIAAFIGYLAWYAQSPLDYGPLPKEVRIRHGLALKGVANALAAQDVLSGAWRFDLLARLLGDASKLKSGNYLLAEDFSPLRLIDILTGQDAAEAEMQIDEGWTFSQLRTHLDAAPSLAHDTEKLSDAQIMAKLGAPGVSPEGMFLPDAYFYPTGASDLDVLKRAMDAMRQQLADAWQRRAPGLPYQTPYDALIMASLVEQESARSDERPLIARVFVNRLNIGMRLQTDPSVIFGMGAAYTGVIHKSDLLQDTPYNTYTRPGLPPTPIALPSGNAIASVMHPADSKALYFVAKGDGTHYFSDTLAEHNAAVARYQLHKQ